MWWENLLNSHSKFFISYSEHSTILYTWCLRWHVFVNAKINSLPWLAGFYTFFSELVMSLFLKCNFFKANGAKVIRTRKRPIGFIPSVPSLCVSFLYIYFFFGSYLSHFSDFCFNTTTGSRCILYQTFGRSNFFRRVFGKKVNFQIFLRA